MKPGHIPGFVERLREQIQEGLPGPDVQYLMAPGMRPRYLRPEDIPGHPRLSSVLLMIYPKAGSLHTAFIKRTEDEGMHSGQISLPGGKKEDTDADLQSTALRETEEELGIAVNDIQVIGQLSHLYIDVSHFLVYPFVGCLHREPRFRPEPKEVERVIEWPLDGLMACKVLDGDIPVRGMKVRAPYYPLGRDQLWGATAMIVREFVAIAGACV